ncbi:hypothetical protein ABIE56_004448 [Luteibacter sp. 621]|uniref:hypothetical protein n=1 Tax=Luteibacter sp. 621 TaxID=3373916 RepID=UPI003D1CA272
MTALSDAPPWVERTENDDGEVLVIDDMEAHGVAVVVEGGGRPVGTLVQVRWFGVGDGDSPTPPYETPWQEMKRANAPLAFTVPVVEANLRPGVVHVAYTVLSPDGIASTSRTRRITVSAASRLLAPQLPEAKEGTVQLDPAAQPLALVAPRQPWLVPPGSEITFFWEIDDTTNDKGRGWDRVAMLDADPALGRLPLPALLRAIGRTLIVSYTVDTFAGTLALRHLRSPSVTLHVDGKGATFPAPMIPGVTSGLLAMDAFGRSVPVEIQRWPGISDDQLIWITLEGTTADGSTAVVIADGTSVTNANLAEGFITSFPADLLEPMLDGSTLILRCSVSLGGGGEAERVDFPLTSYTLVHAGAARGRAMECESFDGAIGLRAGEKQRLRFLSVKCTAGQITSNAATATDPNLTGTYLSLVTDGSEAEIRLDRPVTKLTVAMAIRTPAYPALVVTYDQSGAALETRHVTITGRAQFEAADNERRIAWLRILAGTSQGVSLDDIIAVTGYAWAEQIERFTETFNDLPPGEHGELFAFERWSISTDGGNVTIAPDPASNRGSCLSIRTTPAGRVHYFTPHFGVRPRSRIALRLRTSGSTSHRAVVEVVYLNIADLTTRAVSVSTNLTANFATVVVPSNELARDLEFVSHLRIVHDTGNAITAVLYDDITFE